MKALALALVAQLALAQDAGTDVPLAVVQGQGCFLPEARCIAVAKELAACRVEVPALKLEPQPTPTGYVVAVIVGIVAGLVGGAVVTAKVCGGTSLCR